MADYWKSTPKKLCNICNIWIYDNRPVIRKYNNLTKEH